MNGRLEGEGIIAADIRSTPNLWYRVHHEVPTPVVKRSTSGLAIPSDLPPINTNPVRGRIFEHWRELVRDTLNFPNISVCISTKGTPPEGPNDWVLAPWEYQGHYQKEQSVTGPSLTCRNQSFVRWVTGHTA